MKRKILVTMAITALMFSLVTPVLAEEIPIEDFKVVKDFPSNMIAGLTYEAVYQFRNSSLQSIPIQVCLKIEHPMIEKGEWFAKMNSVSMNEIKAGAFWSDIYYVEARTQLEYNVEVSSSPIILPTEYTFTIELWSGSVRVYPPKEAPSEELPTYIPYVPEEPTYPLEFWILILLAAVIIAIISLGLINKYRKEKITNES